MSNGAGMLKAANTQVGLNFSHTLHSTAATKFYASMSFAQGGTADRSFEFCLQFKGRPTCGRLKRRIQTTHVLRITLSKFPNDGVHLDTWGLTTSKL